MGRYDGYWEMRQGGPKMRGREIYKCTDCGAETVPEKGWNGAPEPGHCKSGCKNRETDWKPGNATASYRKNFDRIFPNAPGAGL